MTNQRTAVLSAAIVIMVLLSSWIVYSAIRTSQTKFAAGLPPEDIRKNLFPRQVELSTMRPPALRQGDPVRFGGATSVASVIEYGDFECETCRAFKPVIDQVLPKFNGKVRFVWRHLPISDTNPNALDAAVFAHCAGLQGKFWPAYDALFSANNLNESVYTGIARQLSLNMAGLSQCRGDQTVRATIQTDVDIARNDGVSGAPFIFIGTSAHRGSLTAEELEREISLFLGS